MSTHDKIFNFNLTIVMASQCTEVHCNLNGQLTKCRKTKHGNISMTFIWYVFIAKPFSNCLFQFFYITKLQYRISLYTKLSSSCDYKFSLCII